MSNMMELSPTDPFLSETSSGYANNSDSMSDANNVRLRNMKVEIFVLIMNVNLIFISQILQQHNLQHISFLVLVIFF